MLIYIVGTFTTVGTPPPESYVYYKQLPPL